ncbi:MAG TPA: pyridoxal phosphate-dependent aminotransferase [Bryobacteraceae bacterium]|nr:pyridoxal phosphate-dependent aminotransferase [Bryobacteraceae bacterium]
MFSSRLCWDVTPNPLSKLLEEKRRNGVRVLDLTESNPTRAGFVYPAEEILAAFADPRALRYDPSPRGLESARDAVVQYYAARNRPVARSQILLTASTSEAYSYLFKLLADPGDEILAPRPSYPLFEFLAGLESVKVRQYPLRYDGAWHIDFAALERSIHEKTRAIVVVNPNNPTGSSITGEDFERLETLGIPILSDEVFSDYADLRAARPHRALTFSMNGLSKIAGLPQMKLGWIVADGPGQQAALDALELTADTFLSVATPVQLALAKLLDVTAGVRAQIRERTDSNFARLQAACAGTAFQVLHRESGWYAIVQVPRTRTEEEWVLMLLGERDTLVQPGFFFDFESEAFLVVSLLTEPAVFEPGLRQIMLCGG